MTELPIEYAVLCNIPKDIMRRVLGTDITVNGEVLDGEVIGVEGNYARVQYRVFPDPKARLHRIRRILSFFFTQTHVTTVAFASLSDKTKAP